MPRPERAAARLLLIAGLAVALPAAAEQLSPPEAAGKLHQVESAIEEGARQKAESERQVEEMSQEIAALREQMVATAKAVQDNEEGLSAAERQLVELNAESEEVKKSLQRRRGEYAAMLSAMARFARNPPEAALLMPSPPIDTVRGAVVMRAALPQLQSGIEDLADQLTALDQLHDKITLEQAHKSAATQSLKQESAHLDDLMKRMMEAEKAARTESAETAERLAKLSADARDLKDLLAKIEAERPKPQAAPAKKAPEVAALEPLPAPGAKPFGQARGSLTLPVRGRLVKEFGQAGQGGLANKGVTLATRPGARVVAPYDGRVVFAGPFRGYGQLLIIAQGEGYHILLAGLSRIDCVVGQRLLAGEPVGVMGPADNGDPELYVELRHGGEPINPLPWMAAHDEKVNG